jgi:fatty-acyl-CoA synthase
VDSLSQVRAEETRAVMESTLGDYFDTASARNAKREALIVPHQGIRWTYAQLHSKATALACGLQRLGLQRGDRVGIWSQNCAEWVLTQYATAKAGLVLVDINPGDRVGELQYTLQKVNCRALILAPRCKNSDSIAMLREVVPELELCCPGGWRSDGVPLLEYAIRLGTERTAGMLNFDDLLVPPVASELAELLETQTLVLSTDAVNIQFTSDTTGTPKCATLSHRNLLDNGYLACLTQGLAMILPEDAAAGGS